MSDLKAYVKERIATIIPEFDNLELRAIVSDSSYSVEFVALINGERKQCYELVDEGIVDEGKMEQVFASIADHIRNSTNYKKGDINKVNF